MVYTAAEKRLLSLKLLWIVLVSVFSLSSLLTQHLRGVNTFDSVTVRWYTPKDVLRYESRHLESNYKHPLHPLIFQLNGAFCFLGVSLGQKQLTRLALLSRFWLFMNLKY
jgi:hypothetical protein